MKGVKNMKEQTILKIANFFAKYSVKRWNKIRPFRKLCRLAYQEMEWMFEDKIGIDNEEAEAEGYSVINPYPRLYRDPRFASWEEDDDCLVSDPSGFVIRHSTSYCAYLIALEKCFEWPRRKTKKRYDAKDWQEFLAECGYRRVVSGKQLDRVHEYVGILPDEGQYGLVVWFERRSYRRHDDGDKEPIIFASTYRDGRFQVVVYPEDAPITWVEIT